MSSGYLFSAAPGMHSDRKPVDLSRRLKTAAGLQLISRSKRKEFEKMKYTVSNQGTAKETAGVKRSRSSSGGKEKMQFTVKNDSATSPSKASTRVQAPLAGSSRMAASGNLNTLCPVLSKLFTNVNDHNFSAISDYHGNC